MNIEMDWTLARTFLAVARTGSLTAAAQRLGASQPTVTRQVQALEQALGMRLFLRHPRGVRLTERALELVPAAERVEQAVTGFERLAVGVRELLEGSVRIAASEIVGTEVLAPALGVLRSTHPGIAVELVLDNLPSDLTRGDADIAIRLFRPRESELIAKLIGSVAIGFYASRTYLERRGMPTSLTAVLEHELIGFDSKGPLAQAFASVDPRFSADRFVVRTDSLAAHLALARAGCGIAAIQVPIARRYPELVAIETGDSLEAVPFWLVAHEDMRRAALNRVVWDWCQGVLQRYVQA